METPEDDVDSQYPTADSCTLQIKLSNKSQINYYIKSIWTWFCWTKFTIVAVSIALTKVSINARGRLNDKNLLIRKMIEACLIW